MYLDRSSYFVDILYDIGLKDDCYTTRYRFVSENIRNQFIEYIESNHNDNIVVSKYRYEPRRYIFAFMANTDLRPTFSDLESAIKDLKEFMNFCYDYYGNKNKYKFYEEVFEEKLKEYRLIYLSKENTRLKQEIALLKKQANSVDDRYYTEFDNRITRDGNPKNEV